jgi:hypothetical protein
MEFIIVGIFLVVALYLITQPLFSPGFTAGSARHRRTIRTGGRLDSLRVKKQLLDDNLADIEFEFRMGKLSQEDYEKLKAVSSKEAGRLEQELARLRVDQKMNQRIEQDIRKRRKVG